MIGKGKETEPSTNKFLLNVLDHRCLANSIKRPCSHQNFLFGITPVHTGPRMFSDKLTKATNTCVLREQKPYWFRLSGIHRFPKALEKKVSVLYIEYEKLGICFTFFLGKSSYMTFYDFLKKPYTQFLQIQESFKLFNDLKH